MATSNLTYKYWQFEVDTELTQQTYKQVIGSGADTCGCNDCQNYVAYRNQVFPSEIRNLLDALGIDYRKEVETFTYEILPNGLHHISGWFHFKGRILAGPSYQLPAVTGEGYIVNLTKITDNFSIGFAKDSALTYFKDKNDLVQVEFETVIPWIINKALESGG